MSRMGITAALFLLLNWWIPGAMAAVTFVSPAPNTWVARSNYLIVKLNNPEITAVKIDVNGLPGDLMQVSSPEYRKAFQDILIVQPVWDRGRNNVVLEAYAGKDRLEVAQAAFYYAPKGEQATIPPEYAANVFHTPDHEQRCAGCHNMEPTPTQLLSTQEKENPCAGCHRKILDAKYIHGPAGTYSCTYCHKENAKPKYAVLKRDAALCNECHEEKAAEFKKKKYVHGPVAGGMCEVCHDPHGSPYYAQLKAPINELCLSCHESIKKAPHVVRTTTGQGHPVSGFKDPSAPKTGREMSCISCHNPHGNDVRYFFQNNAEDRMQLCQMCHNK